MSLTKINRQENEEWWRGAVIYQIYPRSFLDTNGDGIGDLPGIIEKLDYIADLDVDAIWISPFFPSPMKDFGYDVSNYRSVDPLFGTLEDFDTLLEKAHKRGLKIIIDLVLSHTSDQHPWFIQSRRNKKNDKSDWYVWADPNINDQGNPAPPNNWASVFGGSAWTYDKQRKQYFLHNFLKEQPDLNFHNPYVQEEILDICRFWLDRGVDGFRLDVVNFYFHDPLLRNNPTQTPNADFATQFEAETPYSRQKHIYDKSRPENLDFIRKLREVMDTYTNRFTVGEIGDDHPYDRAAEYTQGQSRLNTCYNTHLMSGTHKKLTADLIRLPVETFTKTKSESWPSWAFSNHDVVRAASRWHEEGNGFTQNPALSKLLIALLGCLPGTIFMYQGEELGLPEAQIPFEDLQDPWAKETWPIWQGRDGCRTPLPWNKENHAGFSSVRPWLPIPKTHFPLNIAAQKQDKNSTLNFSRRFLKWRRNHQEIIKGKIEFIDTTNENIIIFRRYDLKNETNCIFNLKNTNTETKDLKLGPYDFKIDGFNEE
ncbi:MAG: alpha-glucosidase [Alphaproteobacteria bacterium]|nr:alpha-glucosidase [Alphaproteobacteria bacterium]